MELILSLVVVFTLLIFSALNGIYIFYPLLFGLVIFVVLSIRKGHSLKTVISYSFDGMKKSLNLCLILILIGGTVALWMASGTVPFLISLGIKTIHPQLFILSAFLITCIFSFLLGTSFGTVGTIGLVLMIISRSGNMNLNLVAGSIIAGAYFGDRCSPMSSSANLVAALTKTNIFTNMKLMMKSSAIPFIIASIIYLVYSIKNPLNINSLYIIAEISRVFNLNILDVLPALVMFLFILLKIDVRIALIFSIIIAIFEGIFLQSRSISQILKYAVFGFNIDSDSFLSTIIKGGGILPMVKASLIVLVSSAYSGIFGGTKILAAFENGVHKVCNSFGLFVGTLLTSIVSACFGCNQTFAIILTEQFLSKNYIAQKKSNEDLAIDIENSAVVMAPLIPWNIAGALPAAILGIGAGFIPYAFYLYLIPIYILITNSFTYKDRTDEVIFR